MKNTDSMRPRKIFNNFKILLIDKYFLSFSLSLTCIFGCLFSFIANSPYVFMNLLNVQTQRFGLIFSSIAITFILANLLNSKLLNKTNTFFLYTFGLFIATSGGLVSVIVAIFMPNVFGLIIGMMLVSFSMGFIVPIGFSNCMKNHPEIAGTASTLIGFMQAVFSALVAAVTGIMFNQTAIPMTLAMAVLSLAALIIFLSTKPRNNF